MKKLSLQSLLICLAIGGSTSAVAGELNIGLNNNVISAEVTNQLSDYVNGNVNYLYADDSGHLAELGVHMIHDAGISHFEVGSKLSRVWIKHGSDATVLSIGGKYAIDLGSKLSFNSSAYYTPTVLAFGHADGHYQLDSQFQYDLAPQMGFYIGYRYIRFKFDDMPSKTFETGMYIGMKAKF